MRRLLSSDPCPVLGRLPYSQIGRNAYFLDDLKMHVGDQLYIPSDWKQRAGSCDPRQKRTLPRPAKTIGYITTLAMLDMRLFKVPFEIGISDFGGEGRLSWGS